MSIQVRESGNVRLIAGYCLAVLVILGILWFIYGPATKLPESLIDEAMHLQNAQVFWRSGSTLNITQWLRNDVSSTLGTYNPLNFLLHTMLYAVTAGRRAAYHFIVISEIGAACLLLLFLPLAAGGRGWRALVSGLATSLLLSLAEVPGWHGMQSLMANWMRLHASDAPAPLLLSLHLVALARTLHTLRLRPGCGKAWVGSAAAATALLVLAMLKPTFGVLLLIMPLVSLLLKIERARYWQAPASCAMAALVLFGLQLALIGASKPNAETATHYGSGYVLSAASILEGMRFFGRSFLDVYGPMPLVLATLFPFVLLLNARERSAAEALRRNWLATYACLCCAAAVAVYLPWMHRLPRYMALSACAFAVFAGQMCREFMAAPTGHQRVRWIATGAGALAVLVLKIPILIGGLVLLGVVCTRKRLNYLGPVGLGALAPGFVYFAYAGFVSAHALHRDYIDLEHVQRRILGQLIEYGRQGRTVGVNDATDERFGSASYFAHTLAGVDVKIQTVQSTRLRNTDLLLFGPDSRPGNADVNSFRQYIDSDFDGIETTLEPLSFWQWRRALWHGEWNCSRQVSLDKRWTFVRVR